jgi:hypothetical protein
MALFSAEAAAVVNRETDFKGAVVSGEPDAGQFRQEGSRNWRRFRSGLL